MRGNILELDHPSGKPPAIVRDGAGELIRMIMIIVAPDCYVMGEETQVPGLRDSIYIYISVSRIIPFTRQMPA